jgi:hypothetical protein
VLPVSVVIWFGYHGLRKKGELRCSPFSLLDQNLYLLLPLPSMLADSLPMANAYFLPLK